MAKPPLPESPTQRTEADEPLEESFYEIPQELQDGGASPTVSDEETPAALDEPPRKPGRFPAAIVTAAALAVICIVGGLVAYRCRGQQKVVHEGIAQAETLMVLDTADGYRRAAALLTPLAKIDPLEAGSMRAFALAMLACDYRDAQAEEEANKLLVVPGRADPMPRYASLAFRALALGRDALADAALDRGEPEDPGKPETLPTLPWGKTLSARVDLSAGSYESAMEYATAAAAAPGFVPGLAVHGDAARRARRDFRTALSAYEAALAASPTNPRSAFGLAKLALSGQAPEAEARAALSRIISTGDSTPRRVRARATLHLAALRIRAGDPVDAVRRELGGGFNAKELDWLMGAARTEAANRGPYKAVTVPEALESLRSKTDDDLEDKALRAMAPEPPPPPPAAEPPARASPPPARAATKSSKHAKAPARAPARSTKAKATASKASKGSAKKSASGASKASPKKKPKKGAK
jgi:tetratricopeptide (TPR) repeat protein